MYRQQWPENEVVIVGEFNLVRRSSSLPSSASSDQLDTLSTATTADANSQEKGLHSEMPPVVSSDAGTQCSINVPSTVMSDSGDMRGTSPPASPGAELLSSTVAELSKEIDLYRAQVEGMFSEAEKSSVENGTGTSRNAIVQHFRNIDFIEALVKPYVSAFDKLNVQNREQFDELSKKYGVNESKY